MRWIIVAMALLLSVGCMTEVVEVTREVTREVPVVTVVTVEVPVAPEVALPPSAHGVLLETDRDGNLERRPICYIGLLSLNAGNRGRLDGTNTDTLMRALPDLSLLALQLDPGDRLVDIVVGLNRANEARGGENDHDGMWQNAVQAFRRICVTAARS